MRFICCITDLQAFISTVYGADCFLDLWPELKTTGKEVVVIGDAFYVVDDEGIAPVNDTAFFSIEEVASTMSLTPIAKHWGQ